MSASVRWLVIGIGDITRRRVIPAIVSSARSGLAAILTRNPDKAAAYAGVSIYQSLDDALQQGSFDAVYVASPVFLHAPQTIACLNAGKHVLCEKPMAMSYDETQLMVNAARSSGRLFAVAYYRRLFPKLIRTRQLILEGAIGQPVYAEANCHSSLKTDQPDWNRNWLLEKKSAGGGPLFDIASHRIDALNFLFGLPIDARGLISNTLHKIEVEDSATVLIRYAGGIHAVVDARWNSTIKRDQFRVIGTQGEINLDPLSGPPLNCNGHVLLLPTEENVHEPLIENFVSAILDGERLACSGEEAAQTDWVSSKVLAG